MAANGDDGPELPLPAAAREEESLFDVTEDTLDAVLLFLGLDNAGKTTLMQMLKNDCLVQHPPTLHPQTEEIIIDKIRFKAFDLAGHETGRFLWKQYWGIAGAIFYLVDAADRSRFAEAAEELTKLLAEPKLIAVPIAVMAQKTDLKEAASEQEFRNAMGVVPGSIPDGRPVEVFMCSVLERRGYGDAIRWMSKLLLDTRVTVPTPASAPAPVAPAAATDDDFDDMC